MIPQKNDFPPVFSLVHFRTFACGFRAAFGPNRAGFHAALAHSLKVRFNDKQIWLPGDCWIDNLTRLAVISPHPQYQRVF